MIIELHAIQSFAPANLNRDESGAPKDCVFGGIPRARVSSQSWKRAMRVAFREAVASVATGTRTKRAHEELVKRMTTMSSIDDDAAAHRAAVLLEAEPLKLGLKRDDKADGEVKTAQLIFFRDGDLDALASIALDSGEELDLVASSLRPDGEAKAKGKAKLPRELEARIRGVMTTPGDALDVALFGRLIAELPTANVDAAAQVAHALGTHRLSGHHDYYTAVDDLKPDDNEGADMIGTIQFNASCLYRYTVLDAAQLAENLGVSADGEHLRTAIAEFVRAFVISIPSGKQTTFAARNPPTAVLAVKRDRGAMNLANAFVTPITPGDEGIPGRSVTAMLKEFKELESMYGARDNSTKSMLLGGAELPGPWSRGAHLDDVLAFVCGA